MNATGTTCVIALLMWGMFLLEFQILLLLGLAVAGIAIPLLLATHYKIDAIGLILLVNFALWLGSGFAVGALNIPDLARMAFITGEGRIFVSYVPLLFFAVAYVREVNVQACVRIVKYVAQASVGLYVLWLVTGAKMLSEGASGNYVAFLTSHTGGGTFFGVIALFLIVFGYESKRREVHLWGWLMLFPMIGSASREALLAIIVAGVWYLVRLGRGKTVAIASLLALTFVLMLPLISPHMWARTMGLLDWQLFESAISQSQVSQFEPGDETIDLQGPQQNVLNRIAFWTYALKRWIDSPFVGIGYGRYNDPRLNLAGIRGLFYVAYDGEKTFSVGNAHNSYIHTLCELGVVGLTALVGLWLAMYRRLLRAAAQFHMLKDAYALFSAGQYLIVYCLFAALTGHALASPSIMVPATTLIGLALGYHRFLQSATIVRAAPRGYGLAPPD